MKVNVCFQTTVPHIYAAGDVIGFPALAATSMEQGRLAAAHMFGAPSNAKASVLPYGIYTIPEIAMVGRSEEQLTTAAIPYETGIARYDELLPSSENPRFSRNFDAQDYGWKPATNLGFQARQEPGGTSAKRRTVVAFS